MTRLAELRVRRAGLELELSAIRDTWMDLLGNPAAVAGAAEAFEEKLAERKRTALMIAHVEKRNRMPTEGERGSAPHIAQDADGEAGAAEPASPREAVATVAEPVDAPDRDSGSCGFESRPSPLSRGGR